MDVKIKQSELREIVSLQRTIAPLAERLEEMKSNVRAMIAMGVEVELGRFDAWIDWRFVRHPAWKQIVIQHLGPEFADECYRNTPGHSIGDVKVEEHAVLPLWNDEDEDDEKDE